LFSCTFAALDGGYSGGPIELAMNEHRNPEDERAREEAAEAAREAGEIGGPSPDQDVPEEERPLVEAGEGEAEGFEQAEDALTEAASHGEPAPDPTELAGEPEADDPDAEYGEPDRVEPSE
jgi:hypothetical protein